MTADKSEIGVTGNARMEWGHRRERGIESVAGQEAFGRKAASEAPDRGT